jgi:hypothetical protein
MGVNRSYCSFVYFSGWEAGLPTEQVGEKQVGRSEKFLRSFPSQLSRKLWAETTILRRISLIINKKVRSTERSKKISRKRQQFPSGPSFHPVISCALYLHVKISDL